MKFGIGQPHVRVEDPALLTGRGRFVADLVPPDALRASMLRSPHGHARFRITDLNRARNVPGVRLILTAADLAGLRNLPCMAAKFLQPSDEPAIWVPPFPVLPAEIVRHVGEGIAFVIADRLETARDAAEAIEVEWEPLPVIADTRGAIAPGAAQVWPERKQNLAFTLEVGDQARTQAAFAAAARIVKIEIVNQRLITNYMETRGVLAELDRTGRIIMNVTSQGPHTIRDAVCGVLNMPRDQMQVLSFDVGGGFGTKNSPYPEYVLAVQSARALGRPVAWIGDRSEHFIGDNQGRDQISAAEMALDKDGGFLALRIDTLANMGCYLAPVAPYIPYVGASMATGLYRIPAVHARVRGVYTHTLPVDAYRGAGRPEAAFLIERLVDAAAREIGMTQDEIRRKNFIPPAAMPYTTATERVYDSGDFAGHLKRAQQAANWKGFASRARQAKHRGRVRGIGIASYIEACGVSSPESARIELQFDGTVILFIGTLSQGQGHRTSYAQIIADQLDLPLEQIDLVQGDTDQVATGGGSVGSRSMPTGGPVTAEATRKLAIKLKRLAAVELEAAFEELEIAGGAVRVTGSNRSISLQALAARPGVTKQQLTGEAKDYMPPAATYPNGTHICEVEIDPKTGNVEIVGYVVVDDFGVTINPLLLAGQVHGGIAQGVGQALYENTVYDDDGQLLTASLMDYCVPRAADMPTFHFETRNVPCATNPLGVKGAGEAGAIGSSPAVINAVIDALDREFGVKHIDMPAIPERVWRAIRNARRLHMM